MRTHLIGIGGTGMRPLVPHLIAAGETVTGSDRAFEAGEALPIYRDLEAAGATLFPQDGSGAREADRVVVSTAVEETVPDVVVARERGIPVLHRSEALAEVVALARRAGRPAVGVAGTSGKTTTAGMIAWTLERLGRDPGAYLGGSVVGWEGIASARVGEGPFVYEADESDRSIERLAADVALVTTVSEDHLPLKEVERLFDGFLSRAKVRIASPDPAEVAVSLPGAFNRRNAAFALAALVALGVSEEDARAALAEFPGMRSRLERIAEGLYLDYAHNPEKIAAVLAALKETAPRLLVLFQPHGYGPAKMHRAAFAEVFGRLLGGEDRLLYLPIYDAGGTADRTISSEDLAADLPGARAVSRGEAAEAAREFLAGGGTVCVMGARDATLPHFAKGIAGR